MDDDVDLAADIEPGYANKAFEYCRGCIDLDEKLQQYMDRDSLMQPFCTHYQLHFAFVRAIDQCSDTCLHYSEGYI